MEKRYWEDRIRDAFNKARQRAEAAAEDYVQSLLPGMLEAVGITADLRRLENLRLQVRNLEADISRRVKEYAEGQGVENPSVSLRQCLRDLAARHVNRGGLVDELRGQQQSLTDELHAARGAKPERAAVERIGKELAALDATVGSLLGRYGIEKARSVAKPGLMAALPDNGRGAGESDFFGTLKALRSEKR
jgi:hypothetical protein